MTLVTDSGFHADDWAGPIVALDDLLSGRAGVGVRAVDLAPDEDPAALEGHLHVIALVRVAFPSFADGRGFTIARQLRRMGYGGRLRARGHIIADQYAMARRSGFDEIEIEASLARRQPEEQWLARADWRARDYRIRLRA